MGEPVIFPGYIEFVDDVKKNFKDLIECYGFKISKESYWSVTLESENCIIIVYISDYWAEDTVLINPKAVKYRGYNVWKINKTLKRGALPPLTEEERIIWENERNYREYINIRIKREAQLIQLNLLDVIEGNFEWTDEYITIDKKEYDEMAPLLKKVWSLDYNDPIHQKFHNNNPEWIADIKKRIEQEKNN